MTKYLILTLTAGEGHNACAKRIAEVLEQKTNNEVQVRDLFAECSSKLKQKILNDFYFWMCKYFPHLFCWIFKKAQKRNHKKDSFIAQRSIKKETVYLKKIIEEFSPDVIICTHFSYGTMLTNIKKTQPLKAKTFSILTDYCLHPYWELGTGVDYVITPAEQLSPLLIKRGFSEKQILPYGFPFSREFSIPSDPAKLRKELKLKDIFTILVFIGGGGMFSPIPTIKKLLKNKQPLQIMVITGKDKKAFKKVEKLAKKQTFHTIINYSFIDFVPKVIKASDCIIGKCGCSTTTEILNAHKPLIVINKTLPQQERENANFFAKANALFQESKKDSLLSIIHQLQENPELSKTIAKNAEKVTNPNALNDICDFVQHINE